MENRDINKQQNDQASKPDINKKSDAGLGNLKQNRDVNRDDKFSKDQQGAKRKNVDTNNDTDTDSLG